jgi:hypothetical protein
VSALSAGGYIASNATPEGRARNRRVEIEAIDIDTNAIKPLLTISDRSKP